MFLQLTWSLCFKDQEALAEFARIISVAKLAATNIQSNSSNVSVPTITQLIKKSKTSISSINNNISFENNQTGRFSLDIWLIDDFDFSYKTHLIQNKIEKAVGDNSKFGWNKFMIGAKVGETKLFLIPNDGTFTKKLKKEHLISNFIALEIQLLEIDDSSTINSIKPTWKSTRVEQNGKSNLILTQKSSISFQSLRSL